MSSTTSAYRLQQEVLDIYQRGKTVLTNLGLDEGYSKLYGIKKNTKHKNSLYVLLYGMKLWMGDINTFNSPSFIGTIVKSTQRLLDLYNPYDISGMTETDSIPSSNVFDELLHISTGFSTGTSSQLTSIEGIDDQIIVAAGAQIVPGQTSYVLPYTNVIRNTVKVEFSQSNIPEVQQGFYYTVTYGKNSTTINFFNDDNGNNLGVPSGLIMIRGMKLVTADGSNIQASTALKMITITGSQIINGNYDNPALAGYDLLVFYNNLPGYIPVTTKPTGGFTVTGPYVGTTFPASDEFIITPTEIGFATDTIVGHTTPHQLEFVIGDVNSLMLAGDTVLVIHANNIQTTPFKVSLDSSLLLRNRTDRLSYTLVVTPTQATITLNSPVRNAQSFIIEYNTLS